MNSTVRSLQTVQQFCDENRAFTPGGVRWLLFNRKANGLEKSGAVVRIGRRVLIDDARFFNWIDGQQDVCTSARSA